MSEPLTHRDQLHGDVQYDALSVALLDCEALQRLGRVYQLGYGHLVFRGATHTRLSHSMGSYDAAGRLVDALQRNYETKASWPQGAVSPATFLPRAPSTGGGEGQLDFEVSGEESQGDRWVVLRHLVAWAALLHDIGHVPLGHTLEDEFEDIYIKHDDPASPRLRELWMDSGDGALSEIRQILSRTELYPEAFAELGLVNGEDVWGTVFLICMYKQRVGRSTEFTDGMKEKTEEADSKEGAAERLLELYERLNGSLFQPFMTDIVANTISADYLDYLRRDPLNLGLDVLKDDRVAAQFWVGKDEGDQLRMALSLVNRRGKPRLDTCTGVVELVRQRYRFAEIVYYHKAKVAASAMLAKVFQLVGKPAEVPRTRDIPTLDEVDGLVSSLMKASKPQRRKQLLTLRESLLPTALLDPEIGDESLLLFMLMRSWDTFADAVAGDEADKAADALQAMTLLAGIVRRSLYKVCFMVDADAYRLLSVRAGTPDEPTEESLTSFIGNLRADENARRNLETSMVNATSGWPTNSILLYVPHRKSQAKGIETGALADGRVITLGTHPAVVKEVESLNDHYRALWRLIVFVHPAYRGDAVGLSAALDALVQAALGSDLSHGRVVGAMRDACWTTYIPRQDREAASRYEELVDVSAPDKVDWSFMHEFDTLLEHRASDDQLAAGAALLARLADRSDLATANEVMRRYADPKKLAQEIEEVRAAGVKVRSREGTDDLPVEVLELQAILDAIAERLV